MTRDDALDLLKQYVQNEKMLQHAYASEVVLRSLARRLGGDENKWGLAGLLHDIDIEVVGGDLKCHGAKAESILQAHNVDTEIIDAIRRHNEEASNEPRQSLLHHALAAGETITGLITATALVYPDRKIASVKAKSVVKRMKEKAFAASVRRETILECEKLGLSLDEFVAISLAAMQGISDTLGL
jgi:putative nucleotidyltransferase with HDIG domain